MTEWRAVKGFEGKYEVSADGQVRSVDHRCASWRGETRLVRGRVLRPYMARRYLAVGLSSEGVRSFRSIHRLVAVAFLGDPPFPGAQVCHNDGNALNNRVENLRWDTGSANLIDAVNHGTNWQTAKTHCKFGHEFTPENTRVFTNPNGRPARRCRTCTREQQRAAARNRKRVAS